MGLQYISDDAGKHTAVIIPIDEWDSITAKHQDLKELTNEKIAPKKNVSHFKGLLSNEEAEKYDSYLQQARNEWDRDI